MHHREERDRCSKVSSEMRTHDALCGQTQDSMARSGESAAFGAVDQVICRSTTRQDDIFDVHNAPSKRSKAQTAGDYEWSDPSQNRLRPTGAILSSTFQGIRAVAILIS
jgi:hypothetical protein